MPYRLIEGHCSSTPLLQQRQMRSTDGNHERCAHSNCVGRAMVVAAMYEERSTARARQTTYSFTLDLLHTNFPKTAIVRSIPRET
jgi:hypothetical protein